MYPKYYWKDGLTAPTSCAWNYTKSLSCASQKILEMEIPDSRSTFAALSGSLTYLNMSTNQNMRSLPESFSLLSSLEILDISDTGIKNIAWNICDLQNMPRLRTLNLLRTPGSKLANWGGLGLGARRGKLRVNAGCLEGLMPLLTSLNLSANNFTEFNKNPSLDFLKRGQVPGLRFLDMSANHLTLLEGGFGHLSWLLVQNVHISFELNQIKKLGFAFVGDREIHARFRMIQSFSTSVTFLDLESVNLESFAQHLKSSWPNFWTNFSGLKGIKSRNSYNGNFVIPELAVEKLTALTWMTIHQGYMAEVPGYISKLRNLRSLSLEKIRPSTGFVLLFLLHRCHIVVT